MITPTNGQLEVSPENEARIVLSDLVPNQQYFLRVHAHVKQEASSEEVRFNVVDKYSVIESTCQSCKKWAKLFFKLQKTLRCISFFDKAPSVEARKAHQC